MEPKSFKRKLRAILSADVEGYSRLMRLDEEATVHTLTAYRKAIAELVIKYQGRIVDSPGDNILAEFPSVVRAVQCGIDIQTSIKADNAELSEESRMEFRIGINLGDIIQDKERIYGDGVNIAARLEGLAKPGGICISKTAFDHVQGKLPLSYDYIGKKTVKNISKPVEAYRVSMEPRIVKLGKTQKKDLITKKSISIIILAVSIIMSFIAIGMWHFYRKSTALEAASQDKMAFPIPDRPSFAVLPFSNTSNDPDLDYFISGFTDTLVTSLSKMPGTFVIARSSSSVYKGGTFTIHKVAEELGVQYVIDGSIQKSGERLRVTVQMIDALRGNHVWSDQYDRNLKDIFTIQDDIVLRIVKSVSGKYDKILESAPAGAAGTNNLDAYLKNLMSLYLYESNFSRENYSEIIRLAEEALVFDSNFLNPYIGMVYAKTRAARYGFTENPGKLREQALEIAQKAVTLHNGSAQAHGALGRAYYELKQYDKSIAEYKTVLELDPNEPKGYDIGWALCYSGRAQEAVPYFEEYRRLNPKSIIPMLGLSLVNMIIGNYEKAIPYLTDGINDNPNFLRLHLDLAACYAALDREEEASVAAKQVLKINPAFSIENYIKKGLPVRDLNAIKNYVDALRKVPL